MKYRLIEKRNPMKQDEAKKWYATGMNTGKITVKDFSKKIAGRSSLTRGDIENVLSNFLDELPTFLKLGMTVKLGDFGSIRLTICSEGVDDPKEFTHNNIKGVRVVFLPSTDLKKALGDIQFEEAKEK
ncbi:MAG: HU family DNA-binding protein [Bacteroidales bacterium]|jgi:predicted histone-like DNA-binding protein|nr:HU family DNA-binding protein [Bacteroidales bacterium]